MLGDELRRLPDHVVEPLLRAFMAISSRADRLILRRSDRPHPPTRHVSEDYNVIRQGRTMGASGAMTIPEPAAGSWRTIYGTGNGAAFRGGSIQLATVPGSNPQWLISAGLGMATRAVSSSLPCPTTQTRPPSTHDPPGATQRDRPGGRPCPAPAAAIPNVAISAAGPDAELAELGRKLDALIQRYAIACGHCRRFGTNRSGCGSNSKGELTRSGNRPMAS